VAGGPAFWIGLALVFALPGHYGSQAEIAHDILRYAESFLTARSWAEPLVLATVAAALAGHRALAVGSIMLAFLCHPIIALPGGIFLAGLAVPNPGARTVLLRSNCRDCRVPVARNGHRLAGRSTPSGRACHARHLVLGRTAGAAGLDRHPARRIGRRCERLRLAWRSLALAGAAGYYLALLGTISHAALLIQAQPWRCLWLLKLTALLALVAMFANAGIARRPTAGCSRRWRRPR
jgi:hypothetical protein